MDHTRTLSRIILEGLLWRERGMLIDRLACGVLQLPTEFPVKTSLHAARLDFLASSFRSARVFK